MGEFRYRDCESIDCADFINHVLRKLGRDKVDFVEVHPCELVFRYGPGVFHASFSSARFDVRSIVVREHQGNSGAYGLNLVETPAGDRWQMILRGYTADSQGVMHASGEKANAS